MKKTIVALALLTFAGVAGAELYCTNGKGQEVVWQVGGPRPMIDLTLHQTFYCDAGGNAYRHIAAMPGVHVNPAAHRGMWFGDEARWIVANVVPPEHTDYLNLDK